MRDSTRIALEETARQMRRENARARAQPRKAHVNLEAAARRGTQKRLDPRERFLTAQALVSLEAKEGPRQGADIWRK